MSLSLACLISDMILEQNCCRLHSIRGQTGQGQAKVLLYTVMVTKNSGTTDNFTMHILNGKYTTNIICKLIPEQTNISSFEIDKEITIIGTVKEYKGSTKKENKRLYIKNCIAEQ